EAGHTSTPTLRRLYERRARKIHAFAVANRRRLGLAPNLPIEVGVLARSLRVHQDGIPRLEYTLLLHQRAQVASEHLDLSLTLVGGTTVIFSADGRLRFWIPKP